MQLSTSAVIAALTFLGLDPKEDENPESTLDDALGEFNLARDQFMTEETLFACGFHRGLQSASFDTKEQGPSDADGPDKALTEALEEGYACGLEARELTKTPPPSLVFAAFKSGELTWGTFAEWAGGIDLAQTNRLGHALTVGAGKDAIIIPAGTPVDILSDDIEKDGVPHVIVMWDGLPVIVPNADDAPNIVAGDTDVVPEKKRRKSSGKAKAKGVPRERGPTLRQAIIAVIEGDPGPLQNDGAFAGRVMAKCAELGIRDKAGKFVAKANKHVPYYLNSYKPTKANEPGRLNVSSPLDHVVAAIEGRKFYLRADGVHDERLKSLPDELLARMEDKEARIETIEPAPKEKKAKVEAEEDSEE